MLNAKSVLITGAAGNLGAAAARELAARGARLALADRSQESLDALLATLPDPARHISLAGFDLTQPLDAAKAAAQAVAKLGGIDGLINTIGAFKMAPIGERVLDDWDFLMNLNARAVLATSAAVLPAMRLRGGGRIVHVAAGAGLRGGAQMAVYSAAKASVMRIVESLCEEVRADGITANCLLPSTLDTPQNRAAMPDADTSDWVTPAAIARVLAFLMSDDAAAISGASIPVNARVKRA